MQALQKFMGFDDFFGTISDEIGGGNGIQPLIMSGMLGKVTIDGMWKDPSPSAKYSLILSSGLNGKGLSTCLFWSYLWRTNFLLIYEPRCGNLFPEFLVLRMGFFLWRLLTEWAML